MKKTSELEKEYKNQVQEAAGKKLDEVFSNSSLEHAFFLSQKLIHNAKNEIKIVTRKFNSNFYKDLLPELSTFLKANVKHKLSIAVMEQHDNKIITELLKNFPGQVTIHWLDEKQSTALVNKKENVYINFLVNDNDGFRYEYQDENIEKGIVSAFANFNDSKSAKQLSSFFNRLIAA